MNYKLSYIINNILSVDRQIINAYEWCFQLALNQTHITIKNKLKRFFKELSLYYFIDTIELTLL